MVGQMKFLASPLGRFLNHPIPMKLKTILILALVALVCVDGSARSRKKKLEYVNPVKPVAAKDYSYAIGVAQAKSLKDYLMQREGVEQQYLPMAILGIRDYAKLTPEQLKEKQAYAAGLRIGEMNKQHVVPTFNQQATGKRDTTFVDAELLVNGLADGMNGVATLSADSAMKVAEQQMAYYKNEIKNANALWLDANKQQKNVKTLPSGLQYRILTAGNGPIATDTTKVEVHYEGKLIDGTIFDSSYKRGQTATFRPDQVIKGWTEALQLMPEGSTWELYIPYDLAYGENGTQNIPPYSTLIFKVEVVKVGKN